ncbi:actin cytoskeleton-regulatory complex protein PAN1-like [Melopsittacus undulatus]|uniref:actin cytoskeleton-regulatory complex protein PAN1-like n=1 Tax=Melopsittacus undulatus TaxID=13146 RepID=UPI00146AAF32|nr:actin cytoskeleton-regulatory complex protein PAN1-like [Melopsittacus undulatus]
MGRCPRPSPPPPLGSLSAAQDRALRELRSEVAALEQRLQELRHRGGQPSGSRRGAERLQRRLQEAERGRDQAHRDLEELSRSLESGAVGLGLLLERMGLQDHQRPLAVPQLLARARAGIEALRQGGRGQRRLQHEDPDTEDPTELPHSSDEDGPAPPAAPPTRAAIKNQSRLLLEGRGPERPRPL